MAEHRSALIGHSGNSNLTSQVVETLGAAVVAGIYGDHNPLPNEGALRKQFGTARSTVREAIKTLAAKSLLGARPRHGTWVEPEAYWNWLDPDILRWSRDRVLSYPLLRELTEIRLAIEPAAAASAARIADREQLDAIRRALARLAAAEIGDDNPQDADIAFHVAIVRASGNRFFAQLGGATESALHFGIRLSNKLKRVPYNDLAVHQRIFNAIAERDAGTAQCALREMIQETLNMINQANADSHPLRNGMNTAASKPV